MGRARKKSRRSRTDRKNSNKPRNNLDRDDDYPMNDIEDDNSPSFNRRRGRRNSKNNNNNNNRNKNGKQNRDDRSSKNRNPFNRFINPFEKFNLDGLTFYDDQGPRFRGNGNGNGNRNRSRGDKQGRENPQQHNGRQQQRQYTSATNNNNEEKNNNHARNQNRHNNRNGNQQRSSSPARLARFCTECSTVRRANLTLRDWLGSAIRCASDVLNNWSDEVGVGRGSADEMDWQPEPVVRVLILAAAAAAATSTTAAAATGGTPTPPPGGIGGWTTPPPPPPQQQDGGSMMGRELAYGGRAAAAAAAPPLETNANGNTGSWGLRPGVLNPGFRRGVALAVYGKSTNGHLSQAAWAGRRLTIHGIILLLVGSLQR
ncbi:hypothetical protein CIB48_g7966 [Xylaria polymorpha]|nr:hypothetical protein CIB48_g7966 [Xylaria polymorpha]